MTFFRLDNVVIFDEYNVTWLADPMVRKTPMSTRLPVVKSSTNGLPERVLLSGRSLLSTSRLSIALTLSSSIYTAKGSLSALIAALSLKTMLGTKAIVCCLGTIFVHTGAGYIDLCRPLEAHHLCSTEFAVAGPPLPTPFLARRYVTSIRYHISPIQTHSLVNSSFSLFQHNVLRRRATMLLWLYPHQEGCLLEQ